MNGYGYNQQGMDTRVQPVQVQMNQAMKQREKLMREQAMQQKQQQMMIEKQRREQEKYMKGLQRQDASMQKHMLRERQQYEKEMARIQKEQFKEYQQAMHVPKLTKAIAEEYIAQFIGVAQQYIKYVRIGEKPDIWKHACMRGGVVLSNEQVVYYANTPIYFTLCKQCGVVHYHFVGDDSEIKIANEAINLGVINQQQYLAEQGYNGLPTGGMPTSGNNQAYSDKNLRHLNLDEF